MRATELINSSALTPPRTTRRINARVMTSHDAGKVIPIAAKYLLREDAITNGRVDINVQMGETLEMLSNGVQVKAEVHFIPSFALAKFGGSMTEFNKSYSKEQGAAGAVIPFFDKNKYWNGTSVVTVTNGSTFDTETSHGRAEFYQTLGLHHNDTDFNTSYVQSYNALINHKRKARSASLPIRNEYDHNLAEAFWHNYGGMDNIVSDFDQALVDGQVSLTGLSFQAPIKSKWLKDTSHLSASANNVPNESHHYAPAQQGGIIDKGDYYIFDEIFAELQAGGNATMSLADIDQAKKTVAFAKIRQKYDALDEDIIDLLMQGISVPESAMRDPILLASQTTNIIYNQNYATDGANLDKSVTRGNCNISLNVRSPKMNTGGVLLVTLSICPEKLFERKKDCLLGLTDTDELPNALTDILDPEKVRIKKCSEIDILHNTPDATFGYEPLNAQWMRDDVSLGGKFYRPSNDAFTEDRARVWSVENLNPTLNADWYLVKNLHKKVFASTTEDSFETTALMSLNVNGNTQFGEKLIEANTSSDFTTITAQTDSTRITK